MKYPYEFATIETMNHDMTCNDNVMTCNHDITCNEHVMNYKQPFTCNDSKRLEKSDWWYLVHQLEEWNVFKPRAIVKKYGALNCWEAMIRTKDFNPRIKGAYFTKVVRSLCQVA